MSDESDREIVNHAGRKGKRGTARIEDSGSESDSSFEHRKKRKKVLVGHDQENPVVTLPLAERNEADPPTAEKNRTGLPRVASDPENSSDESDGPLVKSSSRRRVPRVMSDGGETGDDFEIFTSEDDDVTGEEEEEGDENGSEEYSSSGSGSEETGSSSCSDWESEEEEGDERLEERGASSLQSSVISKAEKQDKEVHDGAASSMAAAYMSDSSDGQSEKCPICLLSFNTQEVGTPESCDHSFCVECIQEWAKNVNTCPVDRQVFTLILVRRSLEGKVIRKIPIEPPRRQDEDEVQEDPTYCEVCGECDREDRMLLCDGCDLGYHLECLDPPMDTVPLEEWFCPDCILSNSVHLAEEVDIQDGELTALLEDAHAVGLPPLRPRVSRLLPRTRQSERVRATMITRQRQRAGNEQRDRAQEKVKRRKRKPTSRRVRRPARVKLPVPHTVRSRLAEHLGVCPPRRPGQTIPDVRPRVTSTRIDFQRSRAGIPTLHLFGQRDQLDYFSSGSDHEGDIGSGGDLGGNVSVMAHPRVSATRPGRFPIIKKRMLSSVRSRREKLCTAFEERPSEQVAPDVIGSILNSQAMWHSKKSVVTVNRDGSLIIKSDGKETPRRNTEKSGSSDSGFNSTDSGVTVRTDDRLSQISNSDTPVNISEAGSSTFGHVTQAPMYPGRGGAGGTRPPGGGGFQQFGGNRYSSSPSYHSFQIGRGGYSNFPPPSSFDSRGTRAGYANYLNSGPPPPFRGSPLRFRMAPRFPNRRPLLPPPRPPQLLQIQQIPPSSVEEFHPEDDILENQKPPSVRPEEEEDEIDIYSDIEVGGSGSGGPGGCGSEPDDGDRGMELAYEALPPPPIPPALLMGMGGDTPSDEEACSDSELVIDDNIAPSSPPDDSEKYDPEEALGKPEVPEIPESEKYDPAEPSYDTDEEEEAAAKAQGALSSIPPPNISTTMSTSHVVAHSSSNSSASYLHSPTYGDNSVLGLDVKLPTTVCADNEVDDGDGDDSRSSQEVLKGVASTVKREPCGLSSEPVKRQSLVDDYDDDEDEEDECPNFSIYSAASMDIARRTGDDDDDDNIPLPKTITDEKVDSDSEKENKSVVTEDKDENSNLSASEEMASQKDESEKEQPSIDLEEKDPKSSIEPEEGELPEKHQENADLDDEDVRESAEVNKVADGDEAAESETADGVKKLTLVEEIFGSDDNDSLIGGATSAVSAATVDNAPQTSVTPLGLEGLDTETISETEEAINFEDELSQEDGFLTAEEDGEIPSVKRKKKKKTRKTSAAGSVGEEASAVKDHTPQEVVDYEEGEIVDDRPKQHESTKKDKKVSEKKDKSKYEKEMQKTTDENFDITSKSKTAPEEERKKKKKKSSDKTRMSKDRAVLSSSENKDKGKDKSSKTDDANIAWKKLSKSSKERNYRDPKTKPDGDPSKVKDVSKKKDAATKDSVAKKDKKKKEKRKDMERYDVRKIVTDKKRKRRDAFGRDLSRDRSYTKSRSRSRGRSYDRSRGRSSRSPSRTRITRSKGRSPVKSRVRSSSRSRIRSRSRSRNRSRSRSKTRSKVKSKDRLRRSRSKEKQRSRVSRSRSRGRRSRSRTRSRSRNRSRVRSRSRSPVRSRDRRERSRERRDSTRCRYRERSWSHSWTPSWSRSRSVSCSSYSHSCTPTPRRFNRSYSRSFSRSWSRERHERIPVIEKKSGAISKTAKKLTVIVSNTKDDSERRRKKEKKRKEAKKNKEALAALEKRKKRKEKSPAPSKEVFTSGDNILVSVNFKSNKSAGSKEVLSSNAALTVANKEAVKRKQHDGSFELEREAAKKLRKDKSAKEKTSPCQKNGGMVAEKTVVRSGEKKLKKAVQRVSNKAARVQTLVNKKPVAIIDLDQSPFHEQTPSPTDLIVLTDSDEEGLNKENGREELSESLNSRRTMRPTSSSPKLSSMNSAPSNAIAHTPESQSPPMNAVGSYLVTSTGPKTPPEPQIKFSITTKPQLRPLSNPLREDEDMMADDAGLDDLDQRIEEELDRGLDRGLGDIIHKGPNTPPEPRGPTTPCSPPTSPDAYDPFDPTKSGTPSPVGAGASMDGPPSPAHTPPEQLIQLNVISRESPMISDLEELANKSLEPRVITPTMASQEEVVDQSSQSPERSKLSGRGDATIASSPSIVPETTSLPPPVSSDNELSQPSELPEGSEKSKQMSVSLPLPGPASIIADSNATQSPERIIPVVITAQPQNLQGTPVKSQLFPTTANKQVPPQQPMTSTPAHSSAPAPVFPTLTPTNIASILCTAPTSTLPLNRIGLFNPPTISVPQLMVHHHPQQQQNQQQQLISSPIIQQRPPPSIVRTTPEKLAIPSTKLPAVRAAVQNGEQTQISQKPPQDTMTDVVDMDLESPYSPGSSEGDDLFDPPAEIKSSGTSASFTALSERNRTVPQPAKNLSKLPLPLAAMLHKSPSKPANQDKFDSIFGLSPLRVNKTAPARVTRASTKAHHAKGSKGKAKSKAYYMLHRSRRSLPPLGSRTLMRSPSMAGGKKEIAIKMDEDQLQILDDLPSSAVELQVKDKFLKKLNRQERVVEEVKLSLKPHYTKKHITKEEYKDILRRSVPKICHNRSGEINPIKISCLVEAYVKKYRYHAKKKNPVGPKTKVNKTTMWS